VVNGSAPLARVVRGADFLFFENGHSIEPSSDSILVWRIQTNIVGRNKIHVIPATAGIHKHSYSIWIPAFAGMTMMSTNCLRTHPLALDMQRARARKVTLKKKCIRSVWRNQ
jgi:hypothetical protein